MDLMDKYLGEAKIPDSTPLGVKVTDTMSLARAETIGGMTYVMKTFNSRNISPMDGSKWKLTIKNGELHVVWKPKGKSMLRTRIKGNPTYMEDVIKVFKEAYKNYYNKMGK